MKPYYEDTRAGITIYHGDLREVLPQIEAVELVVTSPPYDGLRSYMGFEFDCIGPIAKSIIGGGVICWNVGDQVIDGSESGTSFRQALAFMNTLKLHDTMIYEKANFTNPSHNRYHQVFEYIFVFSSGNPSTFNPIKDKINFWAGTSAFGRNTWRNRDGTMEERKKNIITEYGMRGNVWRMKTASQENMMQSIEHPATMPLRLAADLITSWSNPLNTVLDPFMGSGTTLRAAKDLGRKAIGIEIEERYCEIAAKRLAQEVLPLEFK